ncbi:MAG: hypothetical protein ABEI13_03640 [Candidatus Paceibacteria bacterium]
MKCPQCQSEVDEIENKTFGCPECDTLYKADLRHYGKKELIHDIDMRLHQMSLDILYHMEENPDLENLNNKIMNLKEFIAAEYKTDPDS